MALEFFFILLMSIRTQHKTKIQNNFNQIWKTERFALFDDFSLRLRRSSFNNEEWESNKLFFAANKKVLVDSLLVNCFIEFFDAFKLNTLISLKMHK